MAKSEYRSQSNQEFVSGTGQEKGYSFPLLMQPDQARVVFTKKK